MSSARALLSVLVFALVGSMLLGAGPMHAQEADELPAVKLLGGNHLEGWSGLELVADGGGLKIPGEAIFRYPDGPRGYYNHGFRVMNDGAVDWQPFYGVCCEVRVEGAREVELTFTLKQAARNGPGPGTAATMRVRGTGDWQTVMLPWSAFAFPQARTTFLHFVKELSVAARYADGEGAGRIFLRDPRVVAAPAVALQTAVRGRSAVAGQMAEYPVRVSNCTARPQGVALSLVRYGWEAMEAAVEPAALTLAPGESRTCTVRVKVSDRVPPGSLEQQTLQAIADGDAVSASTLALTTVSDLRHPYILHTPARWQEVRDKVKNHPWAKEAQDGFVKTAASWNVPEVAQPPHNDPNDNYGPYLFLTPSENSLMACGLAWQLTGDRQYAEKVATFLRRLSDPRDGYPKTLRACNQSLVQEGHFFQHTAMSYDMILDSGVLSDADRAQIETTLRLLLGTMDRAAEGGAINNWNLSEVTGAFYCGLVMQDLAAADRFFAGPSGIEDQLAKGTMNDGWWYECTISYNMWCASEFTQAALAYASFGFNFKNAWLPANNTTSVMLASELSGGNQPRTGDPEQKRKPFGMNPDLFGPTTRPYRTITDLWNGLLPFLDYRGVMFGVNDSTESKVAGYRNEVAAQPFELAFYVYRDPRYATVIKTSGNKRDLLYGVPELPANTPEEFRNDAYADNVGLAMLRSQTPDRPMREQIQATLHYGTHGWAHGHFDRTDLLSLMRYGRNFWNPESIFYGYEPFMYKFHNQASLNHNMVVVDQKMQEATPGERLLWHPGKLMQATAIEATARWSNPPYGGMVYDYVPVKTFAEKTWREGRSVPIPEHPPEYGTLTGFSEPILQRRLMVVTDDYVVLADYVKGTQTHTFDSLFQLKGFEGMEAADKKFLHHDAQWNPDPVGSAQFVTDCDWFTVQAPAVGHFEERWGPGADETGSRSMANEPGVLKLDVHSLWPKSQEIMVATAPELHDEEKRLFYTVRGDGKTLAEGKFGAWILGQAEVDLSVEGLKQLELETRTELSKKPTLFWANARVITRDGCEIPLAQLPVTTENITPAMVPGQDYAGGPIKIVGTAYRDGTAAEPQNAREPGMVRVDLGGTDAIRFKATLGGDYPVGPEKPRRKVYAIRPSQQATEARFLTVIEPFEDRAMIKSAEALDADRLRVELTDGRVQEIQMENFTGDGHRVGVRIIEQRDGQKSREESTVTEASPR